MRITRRGIEKLLPVTLAAFWLAVSGGGPAGSARANDLVEWWDSLGVEVHGFADLRAGARTRSDRYQDDESLGEARLQLEAMRFWDAVTLQARTDFVYDWALDDHDIDLERGAGWIDLREANALLTTFEAVDIKIGRQILTWGTGDLLFLNDLFPKDWQSFLIGRDVEYLKAPSDAVMVSWFPALATVDLVYTPRFDADRYITGQRISYYDPMLGRLAGQDDVLRVDQPDRWFDDQELALRVSGIVGGYELAGYGYSGYWKSPAGTDPVTMRSVFPRLHVYGASGRGQVLGGIGNLELAYYDSREDLDGDDPFIRNSELRLLVGYQRELAQNFVAAAQYYLEYMLDYGDYRRTAPVGAPLADEDRHVLTLRLTRQYLDQNLTLSLFVFYSPSDADAYLRPSASYKLTDNWLVSAGGNLFFGRDDHTFFGQFQHNSNLYAAMRLSF